jgi:hypothetical protein
MTTPDSAEPSGRIEFSTTDSGLAIDYLSRTYRTSLRVTGAQDGHLFRHSRADGGLFSIDDVRIPLHVGVQQEPLGALVIAKIDAGRLERDCGGVSERFLPGDVFVDAEPTLPATWRLLGANSQTLVLDLALLAQVAATSPNRAVGPIRFTSYQPRSRSAAQQWPRMLTSLRELLDNTQAVAQPLIRGNAGRLLAATVLATFPNTAIIDPSAQDRRDATGTTMRRAIAFIEGHPHADISVADIAQPLTGR